MGKTIYLHKEPDNTIGIMFASEVTVILTGLEIQTERDTALLSQISRLCGVNYFHQDNEPEPPLYGVPYIIVFASDGAGGWFAASEELTDGPVYHITCDRAVRLISEHYALFWGLIVSDPDWRQKHLPNGPWPRLPEAPEERAALSEMLRTADSKPKERKPPCPLPQVFASRAEAEKVFPIMDAWTLLRQDKAPRFQVYPAMSPADCEGRAYVHYTAWRETYPGLMPEAFLAANTMERCLETSRRYRDNTFVVLDRENNDRVVGFACYERKARNSTSVPNASEISALYVLREFQGLGLGKMLLERCLSWLHRDKVILFVLKGNENAIRFYEHMGFRLTGHEITDRRGSATVTELEMVFDKEEAK